ncbi:MAG TPA: helix-turn-helix domain-containing protein [Longimicrobiaceae bacterium]|nr:helix-turn-helix domain-containing protein [Longimicrobiaceae bacterium]
MTVTPERGTLSVEQAAEYLQISRSKCWDLVSRRELPSFHVGRSRRLSLESLQAWVREQEAAEQLDAA